MMPFTSTFSFARFSALLSKEWRQMRRDPSSFIIAVLLPAALILLFGFGLSMDLLRVPAAVVLGESTPMTREIAARFTGSAYFDAHIVPTRQAAEDLMRKREIDVIFEMPQGLTQKTAEGAGRISLTIHGVDASAAMIIRTYATAALGDFLARRTARGDALYVIGADPAAALGASQARAGHDEPKRFVEQSCCARHRRGRRFCSIVFVLSFCGEHFASLARVVQRSQQIGLVPRPRAHHCRHDAHLQLHGEHRHRPRMGARHDGVALHDARDRPRASHGEAPSQLRALFARACALRAHRALCF